MSELFAAVVSTVWFASMVYAQTNLRRFKLDHKILKCPETGSVALVEKDEPEGRLDISGKPLPGVKDCTLWPEQKGCNRLCAPNLFNPTSLSVFDNGAPYPSQFTPSDFL